MSKGVNKVITDNNLQEILKYPQKDFPLFVWRDDYEELKNNRVIAHWHSDFEFSLVLGGEINYYLSDHYIPLKKNDCIFVNSSALHTATQNSKLQTVMVGVTFKPAVFGADTGNIVYTKYFEDTISSDIKGFKIDTNNKYGKAIANLIKQMEQLDMSDDNYEMMCIVLTGNLWMNFLRYCKQNYHKSDLVTANTQYENDLKDIIFYIKKHYTDNITVNDIAKSVGISRTKCFKYFKQLTLKTPVEYITEYRLSTAAKMLKSTNETVISICMKCGFSNSSYFGKKFKEFYGITPLQYRKKK